MPIAVAAKDTVCNQMGAPIPGTWSSRALYIGNMGKENWLRVVGEPNYPLRDPKSFGLHSHRLEALQGCAVGTFVSLGPGDGRHDVDLLESLKERQTPAQSYIPVEISREMLDLSINNLDSHVPIPIGVLCDFEDDQSFLWEQLSKHATRPLVCSMLGGTIGNLDTGEKKFLAGCRWFFSDDDAFLLDLPLAGDSWTVDEEPRLKQESYSTAFRCFLAGGAARMQEADSQDRLDAVVNDYLRDFRSQVELQHGVDAETRAEVITVVDVASRRVILTLRRYHWRPILKWFEKQGFKVSYAKCSLRSNQDKFGMGVALLKVA